MTELHPMGGDRTVAPPERDEEQTQPIPVHESRLPSEHPLYRPRHSRNQRSALVSAAVFFLVPTLAYVFGARAPEFENRPLADFPSISDGWGVFTGLSAWATDHLAFRQAGVLAEDGISRGIFGELAPRSQGDTGSPVGPVQVGPPNPGQGPQVRAEDFPPVIQGNAGWLYLGKDVSNKCVPTRGLDEVIGLLRKLRQVVEDSGRRFELVVPPDKTTMVPEHLPSEFAGKDCRQKLTDEFWPRVTRDAGAIDLRPSIQDRARTIGRELYDPNDTHWTYDGGVVMTYALANNLQPGITDSWRVSKLKKVPWPADITQLLGRSVQRSLQSYGLAPDGKRDRTRYVASDFRAPLVLKSSAKGKGVIDTPVGMIADSFTQFASPFLGASFDNVSIVHPETVAADPTGVAGKYLADKKVIVLELAERDTAGGGSAFLRPDVIDRLGQVLSTHPIN